MKEQRPFAANDGAVSAVIATLLLVAITVVLAAGLYFIVEPNNPRSPSTLLGFTADEQGDRLSLTSASGNRATWASYGIKASSCTQPGGPARESMVVRLGSAPSPYFNEAATTSGADLNEAATGISCGAGVERQVGDLQWDVAAGQSLRFCVGPTSLAGPATVVKIEIRDTDANQIAFTQVFADIAVCSS